MKIKKILGLLFVSLLLLLSLIGVSAEKPHSDVLKALAQAAKSFQTIVDISEYGISPEAVSELTDELFENNPDLFHLERSLSYSYVPSETPTVKEISLTYKMTKEEYDAANATISRAIDELTKGLSSYSDEQKLLAVHDRILLKAKYDSSYAVTDAYGFLTQYTGTCNAYSTAFMLICQRLGIEAKLVSSNTMHHAWVRVKLEDNWYHVDLTFDDPVPNKEGRAIHTYFLASDAYFKANGHSDFEEGFCTSTKYDKAPWKNSNVPLAYNGGYYYYVDAGSSSVCKLWSLSENGSPVFRIDSFWPSGTDGAYWVGCFSSLISHKNLLYFNTADKIYSYDPDTMTQLEVYSPQLAPGEGVYYLWESSEGTLAYGVNTSPNNSEAAIREFAIPEVKPFTITFISEGKIFRALQVSPGAPILPPYDTPTKPASSKGSYRFKGWAGFTNGMTAVEDRVFYAEFTFIPAPTVPKPTSSTTTAPSQTRPLPPASTTATVIPSATTSAGVTIPAGTTLNPSVSVTTSLAPASSVPYESLPPEGYNPNPQPSYSHRFPQLTTNQGGGNAPDASTKAPEQPKDYNEGQFKKSLPWIIAISGAVIVVGFMIVRETVLLPKKKAKKAAMEAKDSSSQSEKEASQLEEKKENDNNE